MTLIPCFAFSTYMTPESVDNYMKLVGKGI